MFTTLFAGRWEEKKRVKLQSFAQKQAHALTETQTKLDKLVNGFLDGIIERETYLKKKDEALGRTHAGMAGDRSQGWKA